jgi:hypothetical protein
MKCRRIGADSTTPSSEAQVSQRKVCSGVGFTVKCAALSARRISNVASVPHMKAVDAADVPAVCTMLFWNRS